MREKKKKISSTSAGIEYTTSVFDPPLLYRLSFKARWEQVMGDYGGYSGNVNVKGINECLAANMNETNDGS